MKSRCFSTQYCLSSFLTGWILLARAFADLLPTKQLLVCATPNPCMTLSIWSAKLVYAVLEPLSFLRFFGSLGRNVTCPSKGSDLLVISLLDQQWNVRRLAWSPSGPSHAKVCAVLTWLHHLPTALYLRDCLEHPPEAAATGYVIEKVAEDKPAAQAAGMS